MDSSPLLNDLANGPMIGTHPRRMNALLLHFHKAGLTLETCADSKHLGRSMSTLKAYVRRLKIAFPDYVPLALRPPKPPKEKKARAKRTKGDA